MHLANSIQYIWAVIITRQWDNIIHESDWCLKHFKCFLTAYRVNPGSSVRPTSLIVSASQVLSPNDPRQPLGFDNTTLLVVFPNTMSFHISTTLFMPFCLSESPPQFSWPQLTYPNPLGLKEIGLGPLLWTFIAYLIYCFILKWSVRGLPPICRIHLPCTRWCAMLCATQNNVYGSCSH